jgi:glycosyltransferase involved in cell wall biosynthesis
VDVPATIIIPTRARPDYLTVTLASIAPQALSMGAEVVVVDDGRDAETERVAGSVDAAYIA